MSDVEEIERAVAGLSAEELARFRDWFDTFDAARFDEKIARDVEAGKLDRMAEEAIEAHRQGRTRPL